MTFNEWKQVTTRMINEMEVGLFKPSEFRVLLDWLATMREADFKKATGT